jgi:putative RecB family exonuclease
VLFLREPTMTPTAITTAPIIGDTRRRDYVSFTQLDQYLRCPLRYSFVYVHHVEPDFVPASRALGSGIHAAAAYFFRGVAQGEPPRVEDVQGHFEALWNLETQAQPLRYGERETRESLRDLAMRMLAIFHREFDPRTQVLAVEDPFRVPLVDLETGEVLDRDLVGTVDLLERDAERRLVVVDLKTSARKYTDLHVDLSLQLSVYSYAMSLGPYADNDDIQLRFDVLTKTKQPELHRYWTTRDRAANVRLYRLASEVLRAIEAGAFHPIVGWQCKECPFKSKCWAWG